MSAGIDARRLDGSNRLEAAEWMREDGGKGAVVVGPDAALCAGARIRRRACGRDHTQPPLSVMINCATYIDHPVRDLAHAKTRGMTQLFLLLLAGVGVVRVSVQPRLEEVSGLLW